ncbi:2OG-Fe(II) oxygenase [Hyphococcus flavus]|uniref:2OG-Fe(II) oxygenase n=1 Tax=Hyphococcus flavus TaxID=1866326 RepID=A0AAE9ZFV5_9PROT|nr:2OG-Fe(II) oxygenase [Hyphococcus flavus]WDI32163.1 2OG-Fe(II) oxygenase [Hyphococcus flavus]
MGQLYPGDPAPWFKQQTSANPNFAFDTAGGRYLVLCLFGSAASEPAKTALAAARARTDFFNDIDASFFGVSIDPADRSENRVADRYPGYRYFWDFDRRVSKLFGAANEGNDAYAPRWVVIDPALRVICDLPFQKDRADIAKLNAVLDRLPAPGSFAGAPLQAPVIFLRNVFEPDLCKQLIAAFDAHGGEASGFMRDVGGKTVGIHDLKHKSRKDFYIKDETLTRALQQRVIRRIVPEIRKVHQFYANRMERYIVACYTADDGGHFRAHRDNTTRGTAHRRFAVSINLNDDFDGGEISFPEYGPRGYKPPAGGAVIFSCSLLHQVSKMTRGRRYAFLPFLYDDAAAEIRQQNRAFLDSDAPKPGADANALS